MNTTLAVARLHLVRRNLSFGTPAIAVVGAALFSVLVYAILVRTGPAAAADYDPRVTPAIAWALPGFFSYLGVSMIATSFPFGLAAGATRRAFVGGTLLAFATVAAFATVLITGLLGVELATGHWFAGVYVFDNYSFGAGNLLNCALITFLGSMTLFTVTGVFAASWIRFRGWGPAGIAVGVVLALGLFFYVFGGRLSEIFAGFESWWLAVAGAVVIAVALVGTYLFLRRATAR